MRKIITHHFIICDGCEKSKSELLDHKSKKLPPGWLLIFGKFEICPQCLEHHIVHLKTIGEL